MATVPGLLKNLHLQEATYNKESIDHVVEFLEQAIAGLSHNLNDVWAEIAKLGGKVGPSDPSFETFTYFNDFADHGSLPTGVTISGRDPNGMTITTSNGFYYGGGPWQGNTDVACYNVGTSGIGRPSPTTWSFSLSDAAMVVAEHETTEGSKVNVVWSMHVQNKLGLQEPYPIVTWRAFYSDGTSSSKPYMMSLSEVGLTADADDVGYIITSSIDLTAGKTLVDVGVEVTTNWTGWLSTTINIPFVDVLIKRIN